MRPAKKSPKNLDFMSVRLMGLSCEVHVSWANTPVWSCHCASK